MESVAVLVGTGVSGIAAYLYIAIGSRTYGDVAMAPVAVLWTFWAVSVALFMFPLQHWAIRQISVDGDLRGVGGTVPRVAVVVTGAAALLAGVAWFASDRLFGSSDPGWAILVFLITTGSAFAGLNIQASARIPRPRAKLSLDTGSPPGADIGIGVNTDFGAGGEISSAGGSSMSADVGVNADFEAGITFEE